MKNLKKQISKVPEGPGVYIFWKNKKVLYVGRAVILKRRIRNYFSKNLNLRIKEMVDLANKITFRKTESLLEAIILEANLIKKYWPKYNVKDRDNRSFVYILIVKDKKYPRPVIVRQREIEKFPTRKVVFGPYKSYRMAKEILKILRRVFLYSTCKPNTGIPCFDYQIGLCPGACVGKISSHDYKKNIDNLILFLSGKKKKLAEKLAKEDPSKKDALEHIQDVALLLKEENLNLPENINRIEGYDISHLAGKETYGSMVVFSQGRKDANQYRLFKIKTAGAANDLEALKEVISRRIKHQEWQFPDIILIDGGKPQVDYVYKFLKARHIDMPIVGISKFASDKLVFPMETKKSLKLLAKSFKNLFLKVRNEAHRFAISAHRKKRAKIR